MADGATKPILNVADVPVTERAHGDKFAVKFGPIGALIGSTGLGCAVHVVPPGKRSCPFHNHRAEEEMFFIVKGEGLLRYGTETRRIRAGDVICCPVGGPETAHQIINDSDGYLCYLSVSTNMPAEICEYPDSGKVGSFAQGVRHMTGKDAHVDYWTGEA